MAERMLGKNTHNRRLKERSISLYARDMAAGRWKLTGEALKFATDGSVLDGQNRLHAIIASGVTVPMFVIKGLQPDAQDVMDSGATRTASDMLGLNGFANTNVLAAAASTYTAWMNGYFKHAMMQNSPKLTKAEVLAAVRETPELSETAPIVSNLRATLPLPAGSIVTAHILFARIDADDCVEFFDRVKDLRTTGKGDPVNTLLKRVGEERSQARRLFPSTGLFMLIKSWNACRSGEPLEKFQFGSTLRGWTAMPEPK
jgi:hypothetical protein